MTRARNALAPLVLVGVLAGCTSSPPVPVPAPSPTSTWTENPVGTDCDDAVAPPAGQVDVVWQLYQVEASATAAAPMLGDLEQRYAGLCHEVQGCAFYPEKYYVEEYGATLAELQASAGPPDDVLPADPLDDAAAPDQHLQSEEEPPFLGDDQERCTGRGICW